MNCNKSIFKKLHSKKKFEWGRLQSHGLIGRFVECGVEQCVDLLELIEKFKSKSSYKISG